MTADIVNLKRVRKQAARAEKEKSAEENRRKFGESKLARALHEKNEALARKSLDAHHREDK